MIEVLLEQSNLSSQQNSRNFLTNADKMKAFISVSYTMDINQLPSIPMYWDCDHSVGNLGDLQYLYENKIPRSLKKPTTQNKGKQIKAIKFDQSSITWTNLFKQYFKTSFSLNLSIEEHITIINERSSMSQYSKMEPTKWGFYWWFRYDNPTGYLYEFDLYLGRKKMLKLIQVKMWWWNCLENWKGLPAPYFWQIFNSARLINKLFEDGIYAIGTVQSNRKQMPKLKEDKKISGSESDFHYSNNVICCKPYDKKPVFCW